MPTVPFDQTDWLYLPPDSPPVASLPMPSHVAPKVAPPEWVFSVGPGASTADGGPSRQLTAAYGRVVTWRVDGHAVAQFTINGRHDEAAEIAPLVSDLWAWRDGTLMFRGRVTTAVHDVNETGHTVQFTAVDYRGMLAYRTVGTSEITYTSVDQAEIAWQLINTSQGLDGGDWGVTQGTAPTGTPRDRTYPPGKDILSAINELSRVQGGFDWEIAPDLKLNIWTPRRGTDNNVVLDYGGSVAKVSQTIDPSRFGNAVIVTGSDETTPVDAETDDIATDPRGRFEVVESFPTVKEQTTLEQRAPETLDAASTLASPYAVELRPLRWDGRSHLWVGDIARLRVGSGALTSERVRVAEISITPGDDGTETVRLGLVPEPDSEEGS